MQMAAKEHGFTPFQAMENHYNLLYREDERELIPICRQMGVSLMPYSPLAVGTLDIKLSDEDVAYLEEMYVPHPIIGAINKNPEQGVILLDEKK